jgi:hypothetical protein
VNGSTSSFGTGARWLTASRAAAASRRSSGPIVCRNAGAAPGSQTERRGRRRGRSGVAEGLVVRALLRRLGSRAPGYDGGGVRTGRARESGGAPPHYKALRAPEAPSGMKSASSPSLICSEADCPNGGKVALVELPVALRNATNLPETAAIPQVSGLHNVKNSCPGCRGRRRNAAILPESPAIYSERALLNVKNSSPRCGQRRQNATNPPKTAALLPETALHNVKNSPRPTGEARRNAAILPESPRDASESVLRNLQNSARGRSWRRAGEPRPKERRASRRRPNPTAKRHSSGALRLQAHDRFLASATNWPLPGSGRSAAGRTPLPGLPRHPSPATHQAGRAAANSLALASFLP